MKAIKIQDSYGNQVIVPEDKIVTIEGPDEEGITSIKLSNGLCVYAIDEYEYILHRLGWEILL